MVQHWQAHRSGAIMVKANLQPLHSHEAASASLAQHCGLQSPAVSSKKSVSYSKQRSKRLGLAAYGKHRSWPWAVMWLHTGGLP